MGNFISLGNQLNEVEFEILVIVFNSNMMKIAEYVALMSNIIEQLDNSADPTGLKEQLHEIYSKAKKLIDDSHDQIKVMVKRKRFFKTQKERLTSDFAKVIIGVQDIQRKIIEINQNAFC